MFLYSVRLLNDISMFTLKKYLTVSGFQSAGRGRGQSGGVKRGWGERREEAATRVRATNIFYRSDTIARPDTPYKRRPGQAATRNTVTISQRPAAGTPHTRAGCRGGPGRGTAGHTQRLSAFTVTRSHSQNIQHINDTQYNASLIHRHIYFSCEFITSTGTRPLHSQACDAPAASTPPAMFPVDLSLEAAAAPGRATHRPREALDTSSRQAASLLPP